MGRRANCFLFDLDGTILDSLPGIEGSVRAAFAACGLPAPATRLRELIGPSIRTILAGAGHIEDEKLLDALEHAFREDYDSEGWRRTVCYPGADAVLKTMREQGRRLFVISNKPRHISLRILENENILAFFDSILTRDSRHPAFANKEEMITTLLSEQTIAATDAVMVGDTIEDARAAAATGIGFVWMTHGYGDGVPADAMVGRFSSFSEFLPWLAEELVRD
jgi:phosphoglycolate phosphatase